jgi:hypothetical protein
MAGVLTDLATRADALASQTTSTTALAPKPPSNQPTLPVIPPIVQPPAQFTPGPLPITAPFEDLISAVPYRSQWDKDADFSGSTADCGPACVAMVLEFYGRVIDINQLSRDAGLTSNRHFTLPADLIRAASLYGTTLVRRYACTLDTLADEIAARRPVICLIHYGALDTLRQDRNYNIGHWIVVVGVDDKSVYIHDPDWQVLHRDQGRGLAIPRDMFVKAWAECALDGNTPNQCLSVEVKR